jgi:SAM-dependent methyltransferase
VPARVYRADLERFDAGRKAFWFNPHRFLRDGENDVEVVHAETGAPLHGGRARIAGFGADDGARAQRRWREDREFSVSLTWGAEMTGDTFVDAVLERVSFDPGVRILEIGPGYGRILTTLLDRKLSFESYTGLDLSASRSAALEAQFGEPRIRFETGDAASSRVGEGFALVVSSATFEHLHPSFERAAANLHAQLAPGGWLCVDFVQEDPEMLVSHAWYEDAAVGGAFVRVYARAELEDLAQRAGFRVGGVGSIVLGRSADGYDVRRIFLAAQRAG